MFFDRILPCALKTASKQYRETSKQEVANVILSNAIE